MITFRCMLLATLLNILKKYHKNSSIILKIYGFNVEKKINFPDLDVDITIVKENIFQKKHRISLSNSFFYKL